MVGFSDRRLRRGLLPSDVSGLSEARFREKVQLSRALRRAFDKAVRRKPPVIAADAGPMQIQWGEGEVSRCAGGVRRSAQSFRILESGFMRQPRPGWEENEAGSGQL